MYVLQRDHKWVRPLLRALATLRYPLHAIAHCACELEQRHALRIRILLCTVGGSMLTSDCCWLCAYLQEPFLVLEPCRVSPRRRRSPASLRPTGTRSAARL